MRGNLDRRFPALEDRNQNDHIAHFEDLITEKSAHIGTLKLFALCCGEINALKAHRKKDNGGGGGFFSTPKDTPREAQP